MKTEHESPAVTNPAAADPTTGPTKMSRREALAIVGKHAVYTAPAVLAILSVTKSKGALAVVSPE